MGFGENHVPAGGLFVPSHRFLHPLTIITTKHNNRIHWFYPIAYNQKSTGCDQSNPKQENQKKGNKQKYAATFEKAVFLFIR
jgi:hypothetical protein